MKIYIDTCGYSRPFDNRLHMRQERIRREVECLIDALDIGSIAGFTIIGSPMVKLEIGRIKNDGKKRQFVMDFYDCTITENAPLTESVKVRAAELMAFGVQEYDAYHVAFAESAGADYLLTTDDRLLNASERLRFAVSVVNPITFMQEYEQWRQR